MKSGEYRRCFDLCCVDSTLKLCHFFNQPLIAALQVLLMDSGPSKCTEGLLVRLGDAKSDMVAVLITPDCH